MLFPIRGKQITDIPRRRRADFNAWRDNLADSDYEAVVEAINGYINGRDCFISSFIPRAIWGDVPCQPLIDACNQNEEHAGFFFGLIVWQVMIDHKEKWVFKISDKEDDVLGTTYWRKNG
jgi:hypothetical protein